jgi:hypothetical protein
MAVFRSAKDDTKTRGSGPEPLLNSNLLLNHALNLSPIMVAQTSKCAIAGERRDGNAVGTLGASDLYESGTRQTKHIHGCESASFHRANASAGNVRSIIISRKSGRPRSETSASSFAIALALR